MWVSDRRDSKLYAYNMPGNADLSGLSLSAGTLEPAFHRVTTSYAASAPSAVSTITVTALASDAGQATVEFLDASDETLADADLNTAGHQVDLAVGENTIKIKVTAEDGLTTRTYTLVVTRAGPNTDLSDLRVNGVSVPGFESDVKYKSSGVQRGVAASVAQATIEGVTDDPDAAVAYLGTDTDEMTRRPPGEPQRGPERDLDRRHRGRRRHDEDLPAERQPGARTRPSVGGRRTTSTPWWRPGTTHPWASGRTARPCGWRKTTIRSISSSLSRGTPGCAIPTRTSKPCGRLRTRTSGASGRTA